MRNYDPLDTREQERRRDAETQRDKLTREVEESDFKWLMSSQQGRRMTWRSLGRAGVFRASFNTNAMQMSFNEGARNEGLSLLDKINRLCPEMYQVMIREASERDQTNE